MQCCVCGLREEKGCGGLQSYYCHASRSLDLAAAWGAAWPVLARGGSGTTTCRPTLTTEYRQVQLGWSLPHATRPCLETMTSPVPSTRCGRRQVRAAIFLPSMQDPHVMGCYAAMRQWRPCHSGRRGSWTRSTNNNHHSMRTDYTLSCYAVSV